jgi:hypothetical protein
MNKGNKNNNGKKNTVMVKNNRNKVSTVIVKNSSNKKKKTDIEDVKKPISAYNYFTIDLSKEIKDDKFEKGDRMRYIGKKWKELSEADKKKYDDLAIQDKHRYEQELKGTSENKKVEKKEVVKEDTKKGKGTKNKSYDDSQESD